MNRMQGLMADLSKSDLEDLLTPFVNGEFEGLHDRVRPLGDPYAAIVQPSTAHDRLDLTWRALFEPLPPAAQRFQMATSGRTGPEFIG
jgi:hypothetical protein